MVSRSALAIVLACAVLCHAIDSQSNQTKCRALVFEGGQDLGAWEAGVFKGLVEASDPQDVRYDVVGGVSTGALNALGIAMYNVGEEKEAADNLVSFWNNLDSKDVYGSWTLGLIQGVFEKGLYNNRPFK